MGKRKQRQESLFITVENLPRPDAHPFYRQLNALLAEAEFDRWIEARCRPFYEQEEMRGNSMGAIDDKHGLLRKYLEQEDPEGSLASASIASTASRCSLALLTTIPSQTANVVVTTNAVRNEN